METSAGGQMAGHDSQYTRHDIHGATGKSSASKGDVTNLFENKEDDSKITRVYRRNISITELSSRAFNAASDEGDVRRHRKMHRMTLPAHNERGHGNLRCVKAVHALFRGTISM